MSEVFGIEKLMKEYPEAFEALPECYQADDILDFFVQDGNLFAIAKEEQKDIIGEDEFILDECNGWVKTKFC